MLFIQSCPPLFLVSLASPTQMTLREEIHVTTSSEQELSPVEKGKVLPARWTYPWSKACVVTAKPSHIFLERHYYYCRINVCYLLLRVFLWKEAFKSS